MTHPIAALGVVAATLLAAAPAGAAIALTVTPSATRIAVGGTVTVEVGITGLDSEILRGFDLRFAHLPAVLNLAQVTPLFGGDIPNAGPLGHNGLPNGDLGLDLASFADDTAIAAQQRDAFPLFQIVLVGRADGATSFALGADPAFDRMFRGLGNQPLPVTAGSTCIAVGSGQCDVPEPATYGLVALAVVASLVPGALRRRRDDDDR